MNKDVKAKLEKLQRDYIAVRGRPFTHFFCPILYKDDDVPLCKAHLVNKAFLNASRAWTVQRRDVDSFYGAHFESDFVLTQEKRLHSLDEILVDPELSRRFNAQVAIDNEPVDYFIAPSVFPQSFTRFDVDTGDRVVRLGLKLSPEDALAATTKRWEIGVNKDLRVSALVSVIKAAHLTLFEMLGYSYAFTASGRYIGQRLLGEFFIQNRGKSRSDVLAQAIPFFSNCAHMMRPLMSSQHDYQGTITDGKVLLCDRDEWVWALIVFIKISNDLHCVLVPTLQNVQAIDIFTSFMSSSDETLQVTLCMYDRTEQRWIKANSQTSLVWPKTGILYP